MHAFNSHLYSVLLWVLLGLASVNAAGVKSIQNLRALSSEEVMLEPAAMFTAQVVWQHPRADHLFVLSDGERGVYVKCRKDLPGVESIAVGDVVRVAGTVRAGDFSPSVFAEEVEVTGHQPLPVGRSFHPYELYDGSIDCDWVSFAGQLISMKEGRSRIMLEVAFGGTSAYVELPYSGDNLKKLDEIMFRRVRFSAVAGTLFNEQRQLTERIFYVHSAAAFSVDASGADDGAPRWVAIHELLRFDSERLSRPARTRGVVVSVGTRELFLRGPESCLKVSMWKPVLGIKAGDEVEVEGLVWAQPMSPSFLARNIKVLGSQPIPEPVAVRLEQHIPSRLNFEFIEIEARLVDLGKSLTRVAPAGEGRTLLCRSGGQTFEAVLPGGAVLGEGIEPGSVLRLRGICHLLRNQQDWIGTYANSFWLQLQPGAGVEVIRAAPWWTVARLFWLAGGVVGVALLFLVWNLLLRKTVERQTVVIGQQVARKSILEERQRIARELHDNLEQGLAGLAIQLRNCQRRIDLNAAEQTAVVGRLLTSFRAGKLTEDQLTEEQVVCQEEGVAKCRHAVAVAQSILEHCSTESRASILDLRGGLLERMDLFAALCEKIKPLAEECGAELRMDCKGESVRLDRLAERNLLLVAKEAASNAVRHGKPDQMTVTLIFGVDDVSLRIEDDGCGFDPAALRHAGHFGLQGMRERVNKLSGKISIESAPGQGTAVNVTVSNECTCRLDDKS